MTASEARALSYSASPDLAVDPDDPLGSVLGLVRRAAAAGARHVDVALPGPGRADFWKIAAAELRGAGYTVQGHDDLRGARVGW